MKEHILRELVNDLREIAVKHHNKQCLRQLILTCVTEALTENDNWYAGNTEKLDEVSLMKRSVEAIFKK